MPENIEHNCIEESGSDSKELKVDSGKEYQRDLENIEDFLSNLTLENYETKNLVEKVSDSFKSLTLKTDLQEEEGVTSDEGNDNEEQTCSEDASSSPEGSIEENKKQINDEFYQSGEVKSVLATKGSDLEDVRNLKTKPQKTELLATVFDLNKETSEKEETPLASKKSDPEEASHKSIKTKPQTIKLQTAISDPNEETSEEEDISEVLFRGLVHDHKNHSNRFANLGLYNQSKHSRQNNNSNLQNQISSTDQAIDSSVFDTVIFKPFSGSDNLQQGYESNYLPPQNLANNDYLASQLSPESVHSVNSSPLYSNNFAPINFNQTTFGLQTELSNDEWNQPPPAQFTDSFIDFGYQPLSPPKSVSPLLKDGQYCVKNGTVEEIEKEDDLINIIDTLSDTSKAKIPESELLNLRYVLEGNEDSIRDEMGVYLKDEDSQFQSTFTSSEQPLNDLASDFPIGYAAPLTPPKSVSPVQELLIGQDYRSSEDLIENNPEENVNDFLYGIDEINPEELNIYLKNSENTLYDPSYARKMIYEHCDPVKRDTVLRKLSSLSEMDLCRKDDDGDTCLMIVISKPENSPCYHENLFCLQEKIMKIKLCCDVPISKTKKRCKICGNADPTKFYTLLSHKNKQGDTALSCVIKTKHSPFIIHYVLSGILQCEEDCRRVFGEKSRAMLADLSCNYPAC